MNKTSQKNPSDGELDPFLEEELEEEEREEQERENLAQASASSVSTSGLQNKINELEKTLKESKDEVLRAHAEMENIRNRSRQEVTKAYKFALESFVKELLPVLDSLERSLENLDDGMKEGIELTLQMLLGIMKKEGIEQIEPLHEPFNPQQHEAMSVQQNSEVEANTVLAVMQKGYILNGRLIRPAMVVVSKME